MLSPAGTRVKPYVSGMHLLAHTWGGQLDNRGSPEPRLPAEVDLESSPNVDPWWATWLGD